MANLIPGVNDLATINPALAAQWHPTKNSELTPSDVTVGTIKKVWWQCAKGHEWEAAIYSRGRGAGCPYCFGRFPVEGKTDLATVNPELAAQWHPTKNGELTASNVSAGSTRWVWWKCPKCNHEWIANVWNRAKKGSGCPQCNKPGRKPKIKTS